MRMDSRHPTGAFSFARRRRDTLFFALSRPPRVEPN